MQGIEVAERINVAEGESVSRDLNTTVISAVAVDQKNKQQRSLIFLQAN